MTTEQLLVFGVLALVLFLFVQGRWRYDVVALLALLTCTDLASTAIWPA